MKFTVPLPEDWTAFGNAAEFSALPDEVRDQVHFLNNEATDYLFSLIHDAGLITGGGWDPFEKKNFKSVENVRGFSPTEEGRKALKKWLYHRGIPFSSPVFLLEHSRHAIVTSWKMVMRYSSFIFPGYDIVVFDRTLNWCLFYFHENEFFFGRDRQYDSSNDEKKMQELNDRKRKFPGFRHPYL
ncbi:hypothetical protein LZZ85_07205 [Terrimonas sp. NA20]|uniref:Uncharacterized protein n=1 Tax=Terrimonas ginsenosidimutans TaxID=2908004 RepID=A0ABS9KP08_9BACT|nr:hypothetical protein [Terrimonas ginsenosidimutans]MCG2614062.1 hypothetical protein [Terrimonas ginsenosidimutans]